MNKKRIIRRALFMLILAIISYLAFSCLEDKGTIITIENKSDRKIENLSIVSMDSEAYVIESIEPHTTFEFEYNLGGFNENALNMKQTINNSSRTYNILGYVDRPYEQIFIYIDSVDDHYNLNIRVETP